jgi:hypothetical protein
MKHAQKKPSRRNPRLWIWILIPLMLVGYFYYLYRDTPTTVPPVTSVPISQPQVKPSLIRDTGNIWIRRAFSVEDLFHQVYTPCWEGAYGAIGDAYLFSTTHDTAIMLFHLRDHPLPQMCTGTWVDDRAWVCLAEILWWRVTGKQFTFLLADARQRYDEARAEGRLSRHEGFWSWYNWPPSARMNERIFTNSNMNQMATVAAELFEETGIKKYRDDAFLVWNGDKMAPGIVRTLYRGNGRWEGREGLAAFGKQLPWEGTEYCSLGAVLYRITHDKTIRSVVAATARRIMDPKTGWVDPQAFYQVRMDGNGAFVNYLLDAYATAPGELRDLPGKIEAMLTHVWTNHDRSAAVTLHRESDHGIRNGWNPNGGEDGYGVNEVGTVHAQGEAMRAFGTFAYYYTLTAGGKR